jgi:hypothetical protein
MERTPPGGNGNRGRTARASNGDGAPDVDSLERDIREIRGNLGGLIGELDHRRHEAFDLRRQLRRHGVMLGLGVLAAAGLIATGILFHRERERRRRSLPARVAALRQAVRRMIADPDRVVESRPRVRNKILAAAGASVASVAGRRLAQRILGRPRPRR